MLVPSLSCTIRLVSTCTSAVYIFFFLEDLLLVAYGVRFFFKISSSMYHTSIFSICTFSADSFGFIYI